MGKWGLVTLVVMSFSLAEAGLLTAKDTADYSRNRLQACSGQLAVNEIVLFPANEIQTEIFGHAGVSINNDKNLVLHAHFNLLYDQDQPPNHQDSKKLMRQLDQFAKDFLKTYHIETQFHFSHSLDGKNKIPGSIPVKWKAFSNFPSMTRTEWFASFFDLQEQTVSLEDRLWAYTHEILHSFNLFDEYGDGVFTHSMEANSIMVNQWFKPGPILYPRHIRSFLAYACKAEIPEKEKTVVSFLPPSHIRPNQ